MTAFLIALVCAGQSAVFDVHSFPLSTPGSTVFLARADADSNADIFVVDGTCLTVYIAASAYKPIVVPLPAGVSAFDIADVDDDGHGDVVGVCGDRIVLCPIARSEAAPASRTLFELHTLLSEPRSIPIPTVLTIRRGDKTILALPCETTLELRTVTGAPVASYPTGPEAPRRVSYGRPFEFWSSYPPELGSRAALDIEVSRVLDYEPDLPPDLTSVDAGPAHYRRGTPAQARDAANDEVESWPWFPLTQAREDAPRVYYAASEAGNTLIRVARADSGAGLGEARSIGPERRYPGLPVALDETEPDFNGDGYTDLVLWSSPRPGLSLDSLTQAATGADWPMRLTFHLFSAEKNSFEAKAFTRIEQRMPVRWFLDVREGTPIRDGILRDFDGDGKADVAFRGDDRTLWVWSSQEGIRGQPAQTISLPEPITGVEFQEDVDGASRTSLGVRTEHGFHFLHAKP